MKTHLLRLSMVIIFYQMLQVVALPFIGLYLAFRWWRGKPVFGNVGERFGCVPRAPQGKKVVWVHAVSVGEMLAVQELIVRIKKEHDNTVVYLTTGTVASNRIAHEQLAADVVSFLPFDFLPVIMLAFCRIRPTHLMIVEGDLWPNVLAVAALFKVKLSLINARVLLSKSYKYAVTRCLIAPFLHLFEHIYAQTSQEREAFISLGVTAECVSTLGNIKAFNVQVKKVALHHVPPKGPFPTLLAGSIHQPELKHYLFLFKQLRAHFKDLKLILAPRHFHWKDELVAAVKATTHSYVLIDQQDIEITPQTLELYDIVVLCTIGKLFTLYPQAHLFFLGGTFVPIGGHNLLEPAVWGVPMVVGPYHQNSQVIADELESCGGLVKVFDPAQLVEAVQALLSGEVKLQDRSTAAGRWCAQAAAQVEAQVDGLVRGL